MQRAARTQINLRITVDLHNLLRAEASRQGLSLNSEIVRRLVESFFDQDAAHAVAAAARTGNVKLIALALANYDKTRGAPA